MPSAAPGSSGATRVVRPGEWGVSRAASPASSREPARPTASAIVWAGKSCRAIATSPKARSRSTRQTSRRPRSASATARFVAMVVFPQPPLAEKIVTSRPRGVSSPSSDAPSTCWRICRPTSLARRTASESAESSRSVTTSRTPDRSASARVLVSSRRRTRMTPSAELVTRADRAKLNAAPASTVTPSTTTFSRGFSSRCRRRWSRLGRVVAPPTMALASVWALSGSLSTTTVMVLVSRPTGTGCPCWCPDRPSPRTGR